MHEMFENWSLPWQTLQRSLAEAFGAEAEASSRTNRKSPNLQKTAPATSWLVRARSSALQIHRAGQ
jgi:hypothetical protein